MDETRKTNFFLLEERGRIHHLPRHRDVLSPFPGTHFSMTTTAKVFPPKPKVFPPRFDENALCDALLNIRLTPRRLLGILIDKFYPGWASYSKLRLCHKVGLVVNESRRLLNAPIRVPDAVDCLISSRPYWLASIGSRASRFNAESEVPLFTDFGNEKCARDLRKKLLN